MHTVQQLLPIFAVFDRTNQLRWFCVYVEDIKTLPQTAPGIYEYFLAGGFVVKRTKGFFKAVGADMCLAQMINRSQKSSSGTIRNTRRKHFVADWELIYHEMLAVNTMHRKLGGPNTHYYELSVNHEFSNTETENTEQKLQDIIKFIESNRTISISLH